MSSSRIWTVRAGSVGQADRVFLEDHQIALSFSEIGPEIEDLPACRTAFKDVMARTVAGEARPEAVPVLAGQLYRFMHEMQIDDYIIFPRKSDRTLYWGQVSGPYIYESETNDVFAHRRNVTWHQNRSRDLFTPGALYEIGAALTLFEVKAFAAEFRRKFETGFAGRTPDLQAEDPCESAVRHVSDTTRDFIAKMLRTYFKGFPLEALVADLFRAMGYRAQQTRHVLDDGIDVIAHRDELGIEPPILKIQVKCLNGNISAETVKAFSAMIHERDVGIFVGTSDYTPAARDFANSRNNLRLLSGVDLIDLIVKYYDNLDPKHQQQIPMRRMLVPDLIMDLD